MNRVIRILFVDDDVNVLNGLRRMLHKMRQQWEMEFVTSGAEALQALKQTRTTLSSATCECRT